MILALTFLVGYRYTSLNSLYPNPSVVSVKLGEQLEINGYTFSVDNWNRYNGAYVRELLPGYVMMTDDYGNVYSDEKVRVIITEMKIENNTGKDTVLDLTSFAFESGAWHNQWDAVLFEKLNPLNPSIYLELKKGQSKVITFPIHMYEFQFNKSDWKNIENREFSIVFSTYPVKHVISGK